MHQTANSLDELRQGIIPKKLVVFQRNDRFIQFSSCSIESLVKRIPGVCHQPAGLRFDFALLQTQNVD
jgi:hypothetical protein